MFGSDFFGNIVFDPAFELALTVRKKKLNI